MINEIPNSEYHYGLLSSDFRMCCIGRVVKLLVWYSFFCVDVKKYCADVVVFRSEEQKSCHIIFVGNTKEICQGYLW